MKLELRAESKAIVASTRELGVPLSARHVLTKPLPHPKWWAIVSRSAKSGEPYYSAIKELAALMTAEPDLPPWPEGLFEEDDSLPSITQSEALGLLDRFLRSERGKVVAGVQVYPLHWDLLAAHYCPLRSRFPVVFELARAGLLLESAGAALHQQSGLRWPLTITDECTRRITSERLHAQLPTIRRLEDFLQQLTSTYPLLSKALLWALVGGGAVTVVEWLISLFTR